MSNIRSLTTRLTTALASRGGKFDHHFLSLKFTVGPKLSLEVIATPVAVPVRFSLFLLSCDLT